ncbi:MAG: MCE family protein [Deltaproteobacteria bacterium]|nr:MAG: MCE family protein [Deltaproteobacteria bacterium]
MNRRNQTRLNIVVGAFVVGFLVLAGISLFIIGQSEGTWKRKTEIYTDFSTITGLREGSPVQLAGVEIGTVSAIDFVRTKYACYPATEDLGRYGQGRTDDCDPFLFCAPEGLCAELEPWASKELNRPCTGNDECGESEICVTKHFRRRYPRVYWSGWDGVCARYLTEHNRVRVTLRIFEDKLELIRTDSRATVASNSVLGDQLVNITQGRQAPIPPGGRIPSTPSLYEDIQMFRDRIEAMTGKVDTSLSGIANLFSELNDARVIANVKSMIANLERITRQVADGEGLVGALFSDEAFRADFARTLRHLRDTAAGIDRFVDRANGTLAKADSNLQPLIDDVRLTMEHLRGVVKDLRDPKNKSVAAKLLYDESGALMTDIEQTIAHLESVAAKLDAGEGTLGKLVNDPKAHDDLVKLFENLERNKTLKRLIRFVMKSDEKMSGNPPAEARRGP